MAPVLSTPDAPVAPRVGAPFRRNLAFFFAGVALAGVVSGVYDTSFNSFLNDTYHLPDALRGLVEFPRELPGFLVTFVYGALVFLPEHHLGVVSMLLVALGLVGLALFAPAFPAMLSWLFLFSAGQHLFIPVQNSLGLGLAQEGRAGQRLGQMAAATTAATLAGSGAVWLSFAVFHLRYGGVYLIGAGAAVLAALLFSGMSRPDSISPSRPRLLLRRRYTIFYLLNILYGARKQIFLTFGPWMLIKVLGQSPADIAKLWMAAATLGILVRALLGRLIDRTGERVVLVTEGIVVVLVCLGYGLGPWLWAGPARLRIAEACYVVDQLLIAVSMARTTYLYKIAERKEDLTPTLSLAVTLDHAVSMTIPFFGGLLWAAFGYQYVFLAAAAVALVYLGVASRVRVERAEPASP